MKNFRLKSILLTLAMLLTTVAASAVTFTVKVGNPAAVKCTEGGVAKELVAGENMFDVADWTPVVFTGVDPYYISSVTDDNGTAASGYSQGTWYFYPSSSDEGKVYTIVTTNLEELRTSEFTFNIDDPSLINAQLSGYQRSLELEAGENKIKFDDVTENQLYISSATYGQPIYEVKLDGEKVEASYGSYTVNLTNGCTVDVTAVIPDIDITVTFKYTTEEAKGAIKSVSVNNAPVEDFDGTSVKMKAGQSLGLTDNSDYKIELIKFNGAQVYWPGGYTYSKALLEDTEIEVAAHPYGTYTATIDIDDPTNIILYRGYSYYNDVIEGLVAGENTIEFKENNAVISWKAADGCYISSISVDGQVLEDEYATSYSFKSDATIKFVTGKIVMDKKALVWVNDQSKATWQFNFQGYDRSVITLENGYNEVPFYDGMTPFSVSWAGPDLSGQPNQVYINDELKDPQYEGSSTWELPIADGDIVKFYVGEEAVKCAVTFEVDEKIEADVVYDRIKTATDWRSGFECLNGTEVSVAGSNLKVSVNGTAVVADADGKYVFTVTEATTKVEVTTDGTVGVDNVAVDATDADAPVYNLSGVRVATRATAGNLPAGIYIMDGKKFVVKK